MIASVAQWLERVTCNVKTSDHKVGSSTLPRGFSTWSSTPPWRQVGAKGF